MNDKYKDIINLPHFESKKHPRMSIEARSAQFAPFSALTGYEDEVEESGRITENKIELNDEQKEKMSNKFKYALDNKIKVKVIYFIKDLKKSGGQYTEKIGVLKKYDLVNKSIVFIDKTYIFINDIKDIEIIK